MDKLITNLDTNLGPVLREQLDTNFQKIQNGVDGQSDALNKQITDLLGNVAPQDQNEVTQARIDSNGVPYQTLKGRLDVNQSTAETALKEERLTGAEVQSARSNTSGKNYDNLKARLDDTEANLTNNMNAKISQISSVPETFANLAALKNAYPNGKTGIFVTADNGHKYIWANNVWTDAGVYQSVGIAKGSVSYDNLDIQAKISQSVFFDIRKSALNRGYYQYLPFYYEIGAIDPVSGTDRDHDSYSTEMLRTDFVIGDGKKWTFWDSNPDLYNYRLLSYKSDGTFNASEFDWKSSNGATIVSDPSLKYRLTLTTKNHSAASTLDGIKAVYVSSDNDLAPYNPMDLWGNFDYMINIGGGAIPNIVVEPNKDITVTMPDSVDLYYSDNIQTGFTLKSESSYRGQTFTINPSQILYWDLQTNTILVSDAGTRRPNHNVLLANNSWGQITNGYFMQFQGAPLRDALISIAEPISSKQVIIATQSDDSLNITLPDSVMYTKQVAESWDKLVLKNNPLKISVPNNYTLILDLTDSTVKAVNSLISYQYYIMLGFNHYGNLKGQWAHWQTNTNYDGIPGYYHEDNYIDNKIDVINQNTQVQTGVSFAYFTDSHWGNNANQQGKLLDYISQQTSINQIFFGGDIPQGYGTQADVETAGQNYLTVTRSLKHPVYGVHGNHDMTIKTDDSTDTGYTAPHIDQYDILNRCNELIQHGVQNKNYYYLDNPIQKVRYIIIDDWEGLDTSTYWGVKSGITQQQLDWLLTTAFNADGYTFIVLTHAPSDEQIPVYVPTNKILQQVLIAINNKQKFELNEDNITASVDFSDTTNYVALHLSGHNHRDASHIDNNVLSVSTICDALYNDDPNYTEQRQKGSINEQCIDVVSVDTTNRTIKMCRIGAGNDRSFNY
ncbi:metallophosphoesterase family protein [Loigolactobacillus coryniformis subsp. coryniformis]|uniref:metallophosphoesterase family protein n=1 Tax=Loigolactobacillus coryniformis TaxID=1610 RepID=UPI003994E1E1